ncbi:nitrate reductase associated protein [Acetobacter sicerae]|uniref:Nitrate reductase associated protein n=1 Tax=Acetobacter sicerae TaxID=85325 RepID=A0ABS8VW61_9PROT|nr:nitrate reductase associated protein [Acetobacter sicerae]MCE0742782.1 nitrate reductase associated protein [Acetobacter sicerae]
MLFNFEMDFADSLRCIPMMVRMKLDLCGVKVSLRQWSRFTREDRAALLARPVENTTQCEMYRAFLVDLIRRRAEEEPVFLPPSPSKAWQEADDIPQSIRLAAASHGVMAPTLHQWNHLSSLQRFALLKLTRPGHENQNFVPALKEFFERNEC